MTLYDLHVDKELNRWHRAIVKDAGLFAHLAHNVQTHTQQLVPPKIQDAITGAMETLVHTILFGSGLITVPGNAEGMTLGERDFLVSERFRSYQKAAVVQGVGFGAGGLLLGLADLPALMSIKIKFLFDSAKLYGFDPETPNERLFLLTVFQLAFSGRERRQEVFSILQNWDDTIVLPTNWEALQTEYRNYIDMAKFLQLLPVIGSVAGGTANNSLMNQLKTHTMNAYRMRILGKRWD